MAQQQDNRQQTERPYREYREQAPAPRKSVLDDLEMGEAELSAMRNLYPTVTDSNIKDMFLWVKQRGLNPLQRWYHVVSFGYGEKRTTTIMPSIDLYRQIAHSSGAYAGCRVVETGPVIDFKVTSTEWEDKKQYKVMKIVRAPSFIRMEAKKLVQGQMCVWEQELLLVEAMPLKENGDGPPLLNSEKWLLQPKRMLTKCVEALLLRMAFPDLGGTHTDDEMDGFIDDVKPEPAYQKRVEDAPKQEVKTPPLPSISTKPEPKPEAPAPKPEPKPEPKADPPAVSKERLRALLASSKDVDHLSDEAVAAWVSSMSQAELTAVQAWRDEFPAQAHAIKVTLILKRAMQDDIPF